MNLEALGLPVDVKKLKDSPEFDRLIKSIMLNLTLELNNPDSSLGLALNALFFQLSERDSMLMNEANFSTIERSILSMSVGKIYEKVKGA